LGKERKNGRGRKSLFIEENRRNLKEKKGFSLLKAVKYKCNLFVNLLEKY